MDPTAAFTELAAGVDPPLDRLALLVAAHGSRTTDDGFVATQLARLDALADDFGGHTGSELMGWLAIRGFRGNEDDYYDAENSFLDRVMDRGLGIPISLSVLAIEVGRRAGVGLVGIGLPGEFVVAERDHPDRFHNPFRGRSMTPDDVTALVASMAGPDAAASAAARRPVGTVDIVRRMLANLSHIYGQGGRHGDLLWTLRLQAALPGAPPETHRRLARVLAQFN
ncbi:MAG: transglutaminase-like domain-containing protein [Acidimicrobiales bacterium]